MNYTSIVPNYVFDKSTGWRVDLPESIAPGTRVLCLYRVSTDGQLYHDDQNEADIPMQRIRCRKFCEQKGWTVVCELQEEGVSGHKVRADKRDKIQTIREYVKQKRFDILLVFMFDRIGRIADETPFIVEWLARNGIRIWSAIEGEQKFESHTDKLINYIRYWQADGESEKTSVRTSNSMGIIAENGFFTGGTCPYGYYLVRNGRKNKKGYDVYDLAVCEGEAQIVRLMFKLAYTEGYGAQRIANYFNDQGIKNHSGQNWHPASIQGMLRNVQYIGIVRSGQTQSPVQESLRIIDDKVFYGVAEMLKARSRANEAIRSVPLNTRGNSLCSGFIFCGHCGARLCVTTSGKGRKREDGTDAVRTRYTCQTKSRKHGDCDGQTGYTVEKLDRMVDAIIRGIFSKVKAIRREELLSIRYADERKAEEVCYAKMKADYEKAEVELKKLKDEIVKSVMGESAFSPELLTAAIQTQEQKCTQLRAAYLSAEKVKADSETHNASIAEKYDELLQWSEAYDKANMSTKKIIVSRMVDRVEVCRGYQLTIQLNISVEQFLISLDLAA